VSRLLRTGETDCFPRMIGLPIGLRRIPTFVVFTCAKFGTKAVHSTSRSPGANSATTEPLVKRLTECDPGGFFLAMKKSIHMGIGRGYPLA
jgi:hypothetical protein